MSSKASVPTQKVPHGANTDSANRAEGSFGNAFASLSSETKALPPRFADLKSHLIQDREDAILESWNRLLQAMTASPFRDIKSLGPNAIPSVDFSAIKDGLFPEYAQDQLKIAGVIVVRGVVPQKQALDWKVDIQRYVAENPQTKGYPKENIQIYELYWAKAQLEARSHPNMLTVQRALNKVWHTQQQTDAVDLSTPVTYCDRLRIRTPGDRSFNLGPHLDGGSLERWEDPEYRKCYSEILGGRWEDHDAFNVSPRLHAVTDKYSGPGGCSAFRTYQIDRESPSFHGAAMGAGQELEAESHPHLTENGFVSIPLVHPGDAVFWHCDTAHMVESEHAGTDDASVLYIPSAPLCDVNTRYLARQRDNFLKGIPPPDFPGGLGESQHVGRGAVENMTSDGKLAMGFAKFDVRSTASEGQCIAAMNANAILGV